MLSDAVLTSLISTAGSVLTTIVVVVSGRRTREHVKSVKRDVKEIREALYLPSDPNDEHPHIDVERIRHTDPKNRGD